jgi:hypothetical protein
MSGFGRGLSRGFVLCAGLALLGAAPPAPADGKVKLAALGALTPGMWQLRELDGDGVPQSLCAADLATLMRTEHRNTSCTTTVISDEPKSATIHYNCAAGGFGRTSLRVETSKLAKIDTQGIAGNVPFAHRLLARHVGSCPQARLGSRR